MAFAPSAYWNLRSITHLANYQSRNLPMNSSDEPFFSMWPKTTHHAPNRQAGPLTEHVGAPAASVPALSRDPPFGRASFRSLRHPRLIADDGIIKGLILFVFNRLI